MSRWFLIAALTLAACGLPAEAGGPLREVTVAALQTDLQKGAVPLLIDVRTPDEYAAGHVAGAKNIPLDQIESRLSEFGSKDAEVYVICQSGARSARASTTLRSHGFKPVNVAGGTGAWRSAGLPVE
jgi:rhodanese-related sulfurtransferase